MREGNAVALPYKASEGHMGGLTFLISGIFEFDPVEGVIHKELRGEVLVIVFCFLFFSTGT